MKITSFNIADVGYHYIGLRVLKSLPTTTKEAQGSAISKNVAKYTSDKALRLMLPAPKGDFTTIGEKICQELVHMDLAETSQRKGYSLTPVGEELLAMLNEGRHQELRRGMAELHLRTYDNLRQVLAVQLDGNCIWSPVVQAEHFKDASYITTILSQSFETDAAEVAASILADENARTPKKTEDLIREKILAEKLPDMRIGLPLFRTLCDRLGSLRLLNMPRMTVGECDFIKNYSPCRTHEPFQPWHTPIRIAISDQDFLQLYLSEPNPKDLATQDIVLQNIDLSFKSLKQQAGYFDLPQVRDVVCERLSIPESSFDEITNEILDRQPSPLTTGLTYDGISGRRKPLVRTKKSTQIFNLIRRA